MATAAQDLFEAAPGGSPAQAGAQPSPEMDDATLRELARIWSSPSLGALVNRRAQAFLRHGHTIDDDRTRPLFDLPRTAQQYLLAARELLGDDPGGAPYCNAQADRRARALVKLATAGALIMAAHDALAFAVSLTPDGASGKGVA